MAEHRDLLAPGPVVARAERAALQRRHAEDLEEPAAHASAEHALGRIALGQAEIAVPDAGDGLEYTHAIGPGQQVAHGHVARALAPQLHDADQAFGRRHRQRPEHDGVDEAEDGGGAANPEREREDRDGGKPAMGQQLADSESNVAKALVHVLAALHAALRFPAKLAAGAIGGSQIAEAPKRFGTGFGRRPSAIDVFAGSHLQMERELLVDVAVDARPEQLRARRQSAHGDLRPWSAPAANGPSSEGTRIGSPITPAGGCARRW